MPGATAKIFIIRMDVLVPIPMAEVVAMVGETGGVMVEVGEDVGTSTMGVLMGHGAEVAAEMGMDQLTSNVATSQHTLGLLLLWLL
jgi:hypothetical protein